MCKVLAYGELATPSLKGLTGRGVPGRPVTGREMRGGCASGTQPLVVIVRTNRHPVRKSKNCNRGDQDRHDDIVLKIVVIPLPLPSQKEFVIPLNQKGSSDEKEKEAD